MKGSVVPLLSPDGGMGKAFSDSANYSSMLSTVYPPMPAGQPEIERHSKWYIINNNKSSALSQQHPLCQLIPNHFQECFNTENCHSGISPTCHQIDSQYFMLVSNEQEADLLI